MDLTIQLDQIKLNIRVAVLLHTSEGYLFEKHKNGYYFTLGGRVKANESSLQAAQREVLEEIGYELGSDVKLLAIVENFFDTPDSAYHEICFVYGQEAVIEIDLPSNFVEIQENDLANQDIRPEIIKEIITGTGNGVSHHILR